MSENKTSTRTEVPGGRDYVSDDGLHHFRSVGRALRENVWGCYGEHTELIPVFLIIVGIPLAYSIADGLALGFISYPIIKGFSGRGREINWLTYVLAIVLVLYFVFVRSRMG